MNYPQLRYMRSQFNQQLQGYSGIDVQDNINLMKVSTAKVHDIDNLHKHTRQKMT
jgi:hypothetical protein